MSEEIAEVETETTPVVPETEQPEVTEDNTEVKSEEPKDDTGVPIKNRIAEANRKLRKAQEAQESLLEPTDQEQAINVVRGLAQEEAKKMMEPILVKEFLRDNPDAIEMIEDINRIRTSHPELANVENLDLAYKVAKAEKQDEIIRKRVELETQEKQQIVEKSTQATVEGAGKSKTPAVSLTDKIAGATTLKELQELESLIK